MSGPLTNGAGSAPRGARPRQWILGGAAVVLVGGLIPLLIAHRYGALGIPRSDDWSYLVSLFRWVDHGRLGFNRWAATPLIGQLAIAAPVALVFRRSITAVQLLSTGVAVAGLLLVMVAGRRVVTTSSAILVALTIAAGPLWMPLATTFMTDHWGFAAQMAALACALEAFRRGPRGTAWLVVSIALGLLAVSIRQYALVGVAAILIAAFVDARTRGDRARQRLVIALTVGFAVLAGVMLVWWVGRPGVENLAPRRPDLARANAAAKTVCGYLRLIGLLLVPVVVAARPGRVVRRAWTASRGVSLVVGGGLALVLVGDYVRAPKIPFVGNYVARSGVLGQDVLSGPRPDVVPSALFDLLVWIGIGSITLIALRSVPLLCSLPSRLRARVRPDPVTIVLGVNLVGFAFVSSITVLVALRGFDRYVLPILPIVAFAVLRERDVVIAPPATTVPDAVRWPAFLAVGLLGLVGIAFAADSASFDATRWSVAEHAVAAGYTPRQVDGGFEWVAWHRKEGPPYGPKFTRAEALRRRREFEKPFCVRVAISGTGAGGPRRVAHAVSHSPTRDPVTIVAYRIPGRCGEPR